MPGTNRDRRILPYLLILLAAALAHGLAIYGTFYFDDHMHIVDHKRIVDGEWAGSMKRVVPYFLYCGIHSVAGFLPPAFHALNLSIHLLFAVLVFPAARNFLSGAGAFRGDEKMVSRAAFLSALLFAVHPLCTEAVNYARCTPIQLVALFSFLAAWFTLKAIQQASLKWTAAAGLACVLASLSKEPGCFHAFISVSVVLVVYTPRERVRALLANRRAVGLAVLVAIAIALVTYLAFPFLLTRGIASLSNPKFGYHALTQSRVFWDYAALVVLPVRLCSDHFVPWTHGYGDIGAWLATAGLAGLVALAAALYYKGQRVAALCLALFLGHLLLRFTLVINEFMVEYRVYPAMPWILMLAGCGAAMLTVKKRRLGPVAVGAVAMVMIAASAHRATVWHSEETLARNVLKQYPLNNRARTHLIKLAFFERNYEAQRSLYDDVFSAMKDMQMFNLLARQGRVYDVARIFTDYMMVEQLITKSMAVEKGPEAALAHVDTVLSFMDVHQKEQTGDLEDPVLANNPNRTRFRPWWILHRTREALAELVASSKSKSPETSSAPE